MTKFNITEAMFTGACLAMAQVALSFSLMRGAGAAVLYFFWFLFFWLSGAAMGTSLAVLRRRQVVKNLFYATIAIDITAVWFMNGEPFADAPIALGFVAACFTGMYSGAFYQERTNRWADVRGVLLHENNGFILGYFVAAMSLFMSSYLLYFMALWSALGAALSVRKGRNIQNQERQ